MEENRGVIRNVIMMGLVLMVAFLSQQAYFGHAGKEVYEKGAAQGQGYWAQFREWVSVKVYPKANEEVAKRGEPLKQELEKQKDIAAKTIWEKIKYFFAEKFSVIFGTKVE